MCNDTDLRTDVPEVTTSNRGYKQARVKTEEITSRQILVILCLALLSYIISKFMNSCIYLIHVCIQFSMMKNAMQEYMNKINEK